MAKVGGAGMVRLVGFDEFRRALNQAGDGWGRALRAVNRSIADGVAAKARGMTETAQQGRAAGAIVGAAESRAAKIAIRNSPPFAQGAFFGALQFPQFPAWVGNSWEVGGAGGPYAVNPAIRDSMQDIVDGYGDAFEVAASRAFPTGTPSRRSPFSPGAGAF